MSTLLITYNLNGNDGDYDKLFEAIEALGETWHDSNSLESVWFVKTKSTPGEAWKKLKETMDDNDNCFVVDISSSSRQGWMPESFWAWLKS